MKYKQKFSFRKIGKVLVPVFIGVVGLSVTNTVSANEVEIIKSPITYVANDQLEISEEQVVKQGNDGKLEFSKNAVGLPTVTKTPPTETIIEVGTKPKVEEIVEKHSTTYELDETKDFDDNVEEKGQDGIEKITTSYKLQTSIDKRLLSPETEYEHDIQKNYTRTIEEADGSIKNIAIEKIDLDKLKTREEHIEALTTLAYKWSLGAIIGENSVSKIEEVGDLKSAEDIKRFHNSNFVSDKHIDIIKFDYDLSKELINKITSEYGPLTNDNFEKDDASDLIASLEYLIKLHEEKVSDVGATPKLKINYSEKISEELRSEFETKLDELPDEIKRIVPVVSFENIESTGFTSPTSNQIRLDDTPSRNTKVLNAEELLEVFLHELGHVIDFKGGVYQEQIDEDGNGKSDDWAYGFSFSPEWLSLFKEYYEENENVWEYISKNKNRRSSGKAVSEAFAESFSKYMLKKVYGIEYLRYAKNEYTNPTTGEKRISHLYVRPGQAVNVYTNGNKVVRVNYENAYDVFSKVEPYFDRLYNQLFEHPRVIKIVENQISREIQTKKDGKIIFGARPIEQEEIIPYSIVYKSDSSKDLGYEYIIEGKDGKKVIRTSYILTDQKPEPKSEIIVDEKVQNKVIIRGTKNKQEIIENIEDNLLVKNIILTVYNLDEKTGVITETVTTNKIAKLNKNLLAEKTELSKLPVENLVIDYEERKENSVKESKLLVDVAKRKDTKVTDYKNNEVIKNKMLPKTSASRQNNLDTIIKFITVFVLVVLIYRKKLSRNFKI